MAQVSFLAQGRPDSKTDLLGSLVNMRFLLLLSLLLVSILKFASANCIWAKNEKACDADSTCIYCKDGWVELCYPKAHVQQFLSSPWTRTLDGKHAGFVCGKPTIHSREEMRQRRSEMHS